MTGGNSSISRYRSPNSPCTFSNENQNIRTAGSRWREKQTAAHLDEAFMSFLGDLGGFRSVEQFKNQVLVLKSDSFGFKLVASGLPSKHVVLISVEGYI